MIIVAVMLHGREAEGARQPRMIIISIIVCITSIIISITIILCIMCIMMFISMLMCTSIIVISIVCFIIINIIRVTSTARVKRSNECLVRQVTGKEMMTGTRGPTHVVTVLQYNNTCTRLANHSNILSPGPDRFPFSWVTLMLLFCAARTFGRRARRHRSAKRLVTYIYIYIYI